MSTQVLGFHRQASTSQLLEGTLVCRAKAGDKDAFVELCDRSSPMLLRSMRRMMKNTEDAEDILQETFLKAYVNIHTFQGNSKFSTWLTRIAINTALGTIRKRRNRPESSLEELNFGDMQRLVKLADPRSDLAHQYERTQAIGVVRATVCHMPPAVQLVIELQLAHDGTNLELAEMTNSTLSAVKSRLLRARRTLKRALNAPSSGGPM